MSSYNRIEKLKYSKNPSDVVCLKEFILFTDDGCQTKHAMFKFYNTLNQRLLSMKFEVRQLDSNGELIESSTVVYENCNAEANNFFVPSAKLKLDYECTGLAVKLLEACFDRVKWVKGEFEDNSYKFEKYASDVRAPLAPRTAAKTYASRESEPRGGKKKRVVFSSESVAKKNFAVFPAVWCVIVCILVLAFTLASALIFKRNSGVIYLEGFDLRVNGETAVVCGYDGGEDVVTVPKQIGDYTVAKIADGAFKGKKIKEITLSVSDGVSYVIEKNAFENCSALERVTATGEGDIVVMGDAFKNCQLLSRLDMPNARLSSSALRGCDSLRTLIFGYNLDAKKTLADLFGTDVKTVSLTRVSIAPSSISADYFGNVKIRNLVVRSTNCQIAEGALDGIDNVEIAGRV